MRSPASHKTRDSKRVLRVVERDGIPVSMSASAIWPECCYVNWTQRLGHVPRKSEADRVVKYVPAPPAALARGGAK